MADDGEIVALTEDVKMNINLTKLVSLDLAGFTVTGNVNITSETVGTLTISAGTITRNLIVDVPNATVNNSATVTETINIKDVSGNTWNELVSGNKLVFEAEGKTLNIVKGVSELTIEADATIITSSTVEAKVAENVTVTVKVSADATEEIVIEGTGEVVELDPAKSTPEMVTVTFNSNGGNEIGAIKVEKGKTIVLPKAPTKDGFTFDGWFTDDENFKNAFTEETLVTENITVYAKWIAIVVEDVVELEIEGLVASDVRYLVFGLKEGNVQKAVTLDEVKNFIEDTYEVNFNISAIEVEDGKISVKGTILKAEDWNKIKEKEVDGKTGDKSVPYKITILKDDTSTAKENKIAKIAIYEEGKVEIEKLQ